VDTVCFSKNTYRFTPQINQIFMTGHASPIITTIVASLAFAYFGGLAARLLRLPNIIGYIVAGVFLGPHIHIPGGLIADQQLTTDLAEIGVALLMFKIGLHFRLADLLIVWPVAVPGALLQIATSTVLGYFVGLLLGWPTMGAIVLGLAIAISSTAVATKALEEKQQLSTEVGRVTLGWLVVQDVVVIIALVLLPVAKDASGLGFTLAFGKELAKFGIIAFALLGLGRWLLPSVLSLTARIGSHELFTLGVIVIGLGVAYGLSTLVGLSLALGAFFAGLVLGESDLSHQAAADSLPIQNIFTVLFFVSVGMLFNPGLFMTAKTEIVLIFLTVLLGCGLVFLGLMLLFGLSPLSAGPAAGALTQIGEFSFVLTSLATNLGILGRDQQGIILAAAIFTILFHTLTIHAYTRLGKELRKKMPRRKRKLRRTNAEARRMATLDDHTIIVGYGRVGKIVADALRRGEQNFVVVEGHWWRSQAARTERNMVVFGDATQPNVMRAARPAHARLIVVALPDAFQSRRVIELARQANPRIMIVARVHSDQEFQYLTDLGVGLVIMGEREIAFSMSDFALQHAGLNAQAAQEVVDALRRESSSVTLEEMLHETPN
jgi:CPA2 family monovalent cation:H+ antiporter-2